MPQQRYSHESDVVLLYRIECISCEWYSASQISNENKQQESMVFLDRFWHDRLILLPILLYIFIYLFISLIRITFDPMSNDDAIIMKHQTAQWNVEKLANFNILLAEYEWLYNFICLYTLGRWKKRIRGGQHKNFRNCINSEWIAYFPPLHYYAMIPTIKKYCGLAYFSTIFMNFRDNFIIIRIVIFWDIYIEQKRMSVVYTSFVCSK